MRAQDETRHSSTLRDYLQVVRRRKWIILQAVVLVPLVAVLYAHRQQKVYEASASVLLSQQHLANAVTGVPDTTSFQTADQIAETQAQLARTPRVARSAIVISGLTDRTSGQLLGSSFVTPEPNGNILDFNVDDTSPTIAAQLATAYARAYTKYRLQLDTTSLEGARRQVARRLAELSAGGYRDSSLYGALAKKEELLRTMEALQTQNANVVREADGAWQIAPHPYRNGIVGLALGVMLGLGLAFLREALDTRVRSAEEIHTRLGLPLLARLPQPPKALRKADDLVIVKAPASGQAEAFRMLRTNLDFVTLDRNARSIMVTSALESEGKSTTAANLAVAIARSGKRVILVDLDLRRPYLGKLFRVTAGPGLTQVILGQAKIDDALIPVPLVARRSRPPEGSQNGAPSGDNGHARYEGMLEVLLTGPLPPNIDEFVGTRALAALLQDLRKRADVVIVDSPPLLVVGDAMALTGVVDALLVVTRINVLRRPTLKELARVLESSPAEKLGFIVTGADVEEGYYDYEEYRRRAEFAERAEARAGQ